MLIKRDRVLTSKIQMKLSRKKMLFCIFLLVACSITFGASSTYSTMTFYYQFDAMAKDTEFVRFISNPDVWDSAIPEDGITLDTDDMSTPQYYMLIYSNKPNAVYDEITIIFSPFTDKDNVNPPISHYEVEILDSAQGAVCSNNGIVDVGSTEDTSVTLNEFSVDSSVLAEVISFTYTVDTASAAADEYTSTVTVYMNGK